VDLGLQVRFARFARGS